MAERHGPFSLDGRVAVVTGALGLLGRRHCCALAGEGARVVAVDLDRAACEAFAGELSAGHGREALGVAADVADPDALAHLLAAVLGRFGRLDVLVNNAALDDKVDHPGADPERLRFENYPLELWERSLRV